MMRRTGAVVELITGMVRPLQFGLLQSLRRTAHRVLREVTREMSAARTPKRPGNGPSACRRTAGQPAGDAAAGAVPVCGRREDGGGSARSEYGAGDDVARVVDPGVNT